MRPTRIWGIVALLLIMSTTCSRYRFQDLRYGDVITDEWLQASVLDGSGTRVMWFQIFDRLNNTAIPAAYGSAVERIDGYPARLLASPEGIGIWVLVGRRFEIRLMADQRSRSFQDVDRLKAFIRLFDLTGLDGAGGGMRRGSDLKRFMPPLGKPYREARSSPSGDE